MSLTTIDLITLVAYAVSIFCLAQWVSRSPFGRAKDSKAYFLAGKTLPWWAIGTSIIAANISAEQIIGMSGSGYAIGLAIASYEWFGAVTLLIVAKFFVPIFLKNQVYTMPQFLEQRYGSNVRVLMAIFWLAVYVFVNLTAILWLGSIAIKAIAGITQMQAIVAVGLFALAYQLYGGLKAVALTDIVQVSLLILGGVVICSLSLNAISGGHGVIRGLRFLIDHYPDKFQMILPKSSPHYAELPGVAVLFGGMWVMNLSYFGFNQYIIQRALAAKSLKDAQTGIALSACLKLLMPMVVVLPGIAALALVPGLIRPDQAYAEMMKLLPGGFKGLVFAALIAAIVSSLASKINSISTIFTLDIYVHMRKDSTQSHLVFVGRVTAIIAMVIAIVTAPMLLGSFDQGFQFIQEFTGFFTPGIVVIFLLGMFWPRTTTAAAFLAATGSAAFSLVFKLFYPTVPFMNRVGLVFLITLALAIAVSLLWPTRQSISTLSFARVSYKTSNGFNVVAVGLIVVLTAIYALLW